jgi:hypothetical protein
MGRVSIGVLFRAPGAGAQQLRGRTRSIALSRAGEIMATSVRPQPLASAEPKITRKHAGWVSSNSFDAIGVKYEMSTPIWFYKYFMPQANYGAVTAALVGAFNLLFQLALAPRDRSTISVDPVDRNAYTTRASAIGL